MECKYYSTVFANEATGYRVVAYATKEELPKGVSCRFRCPGYHCFIATGINLPVSNAAGVKLEGKWKQDKYGLQFAVSSFQDILPTTAEGMKRYLASTLIRGIGPVTAAAIVERFGERTFDIIEKEPELLCEIPGITEAKLETILESYRRNRQLRDIVAFLAPFDTSPNKAVKIYEAFGSSALVKIKENPFVLTYIHGFGFKTADVIARHLKVPLADPRRIKAGILYAFGETAVPKGHVYLPQDTVVKKALLLLNEEGEELVVDRNMVKKAMYQLVVDQQLYLDGEAVYLFESYLAEQGTARRISELLARPRQSIDIRLTLAAVEKTMGIELSPKQRQAVSAAFQCDFSIITGGPGTGKTTLLKAIIGVYKRLYPYHSLLQVAPTGLAAQRMAESTETEAMTLHSALGIYSDGRSMEGHKEINADLLVIDECSMIDQRLAWELFQRISLGTKLLFVGDADQLPSVGPGNVFRDLIECGEVPVTKLDVIYRQSGTSRIIVNAHTINSGNLGLSFSPDDFELIPCEAPEDAAQMVEEAYVRERAANPEQSIQILTPFRRNSPAGSEALNASLQEKINPARYGKGEVKLGGRIFREGDRVMQTRNHSSLKLSNGDIGTVISAIQDESKGAFVQVEYSGGRTATYTAVNCDELEMAIALTIHKSQGNEWDTVIIPMVMGFYRMLKKNLIYTAVTRAKRKVILVGSKRALFTAIKQKDSELRNTALADRIREEVEQLECTA